MRYLVFLSLISEYPIAYAQSLPMYLACESLGSQSMRRGSSGGIYWETL